MSMDNEHISIKEAVTITAKSESTIRRLLREGHIKGIKKKEGNLTKTYIDKRELLNTLSIIAQSKPVHEQAINNIQMNKLPMSMTDNEKMVTYLESEIERVRKENERLKSENERTIEFYNKKIEFLEQRIEIKNEEIKRLNEEMKALLRDARQKPKGIMGYLMERITK